MRRVLEVLGGLAPNTQVASQLAFYALARSASVGHSHRHRQFLSVTQSDECLFDKSVALMTHSATQLRSRDSQDTLLPHNACGLSQRLWDQRQPVQPFPNLPTRIDSWNQSKLSSAPSTQSRHHAPRLVCDEDDFCTVCNFIMILVSEI